MKTRNFVLCAFGLAAAISLGGAATASAQARPERRIPVRKDERPEVHVDTIRLPGRVDTVMVRSRPDTVIRTITGATRYDTVTLAPPIMKLPGVFFGLGGGVGIPMNNWRNSTKDGPALHAHLGMYPGTSAVGFRLDGDAAFLHHRDTDCRTCPNPRVYSGSANLLVRFPLDRTSKLNPVIYALGGGGLDKFQNFLAYQANGKLVTAGGDTYVPFAAGPPPGTTGAAIAVTTANRGTKSLFYHWDAGAGLDFNLGGAHMFVEGKYVAINTIGGNSHLWPVVAGFNFGW